METLVITALAVASRAFASRESGAAALLSAGHTYTQTRREYCPACDAVLAQVGGPTIELDADGNPYECDLGPDPSDIWPEDCTCERDALTGARHFCGELAGVELRGVRRANDAAEMQLRHAVALENRAVDMAEAAAVAAFFGDDVEVARCETDVEALLDMARDIVAELPEQTNNGADGANLNCEEMLDDNTGRWDHERDAYLSGEMPRRERCESVLRDFERVDAERMAQERGRVAASQRAAAASARRTRTYMALRKELLRCQSNERRAIARFDWKNADSWKQRAFRVVRGMMDRYSGSIGAHGAGDSLSCLYLTKAQKDALWQLNDRRATK